MLNLFPWQQAQWQRFLSMQNQNRLPHALLLTGNQGLGLMHFAQLISRHLLCLNPNADNQFCGACQSCQLFEVGNHPDIQIIEPEEAGKQLKVAQIRELIEFMSLKSFTSKNKIVTLCPAEAMNRSTANALLKTLEEPPAQSMLILISHHPERLPITIRSRCQRIEFKPAANQGTIEWLEQQNIEIDYSVDILLNLTGGAPLSIIDMLENNIFAERQHVVADIENIMKDKVNVIELASRWESLGCGQVISWLMRFCQDLARLKLLGSEAEVINSDLRHQLLNLAKHLEINRIMHIYDYLQDKYLESTAQSNFNSLSLLEEIIIYWNNPEQIK